MKLGDTIGGYHIISPPTNNDGGKCVWAFARKAGKEYFIKSFLEPKRPREGSTASPASQQRRLAECAEFEQRHRSIMDRLRPDAPGGGNLVLAVDFFHEGSVYYKVTERIFITPLEQQPHSLNPRKKLVLLRTLALSLRLLHDIDIVHGDLKPANALIQKRPGKAFHTAKLIDFDDSYLAGQPPDRDTIAGDSSYGAPEWLRYLQDDPGTRPEHLTTRVDLFALGLMTHEYITGDLPSFPDRFDCPAHAVNSGVKLRVNDRLTPKMRELIQNLVARSPGRRPTVPAVIQSLQHDPDICVMASKDRPRASTPPAGSVPPSTPPKRSRVKKADPPVTASHSPPPPTESDGCKASRVRINLHDEV